MRYRQLCWMILGFVFWVENGQIEDVYGMPLDLLTRPDGSKLCFDFGIVPGPWKQHRSYIAYEVLFREKTSFVANTSDCNLELWNDPKRINPPGGNKRSFHRIKARLKIEDKGLHKVVLNENQILNLFFVFRDFSRNIFSAICVTKLIFFVINVSIILNHPFAINRRNM